MDRASADGAALRWAAGHGQSAESGADELARRYVRAVGLDPSGLANLRARLEDARTVLADAASLQMGIDGEEATRWLDGHSGGKSWFEMTIGSVTPDASAETGEKGRDAWLDKVDGLTFGPRPRDGFIIGQRFVHPVEHFEFTVPENLVLAQAAGRVIASTDDMVRMRFDLARRTGENLQAHLQDATVPKIELAGIETSEINGMPSAFGFANATVGGQDIELMAIAIEGSNGRVYEFIFASREQIRATDLAENDDILQSLREFDPGTTIIRPLHVNVIEVPGGQTVDDIAAMMDVDRSPRELLLLLNDIEPDAVFAAGERVRILSRIPSPG
jgi:predicted Zn-dependent protease